MEVDLSVLYIYILQQKSYVMADRYFKVLLRSLTLYRLWYVPCKGQAMQKHGEFCLATAEHSLSVVCSTMYTIRKL